MNKKIFMFIASFLLFGAVQAQNHYNVPDIHAYESNMLVVVQVYLDGVEMESNNIEIGAFVGDEVRGSDRISPHTSQNYNRAHIDVYYTSTGEDVQFRMYDHATGNEYRIYTASEECTTIQDGYGTNKYPVVLNFYSPITKQIVGYTASTSEKGGYYLIASPIGEVNLSKVSNMLSNSYDLYYFDQNTLDGTNEWINQKVTNNNFTSLAVGKGYLYANSNDITLSFNGVPYEESVVVPLVYSTSNEDETMHGWNLIGNPYNMDVTIGRKFYRMNYDGNAGGDELVPVSSGNIAPMEGVFVKAEGTGESVTFTQANRVANDDAELVLNLNQDNGKLIDRAIVCFGENGQLPKFQLNPNSTKVYIPQDGKDYAVVSTEGQGEMPVSFRAAKNGNYAFNISSQNVEFGYLHLIDNLTGADINLLQTPSYSFEAQTTDYSQRFKLVFATGEAANDNFVFNSNGTWVINNDGKAILQVVDVMGHILKCEQIEGCHSLNLNAASGVYMFSLTKGNDVKVQKVVVE